MIKPSHRTIKMQAERHGMKTTTVDNVLFAAEEIPVRVPHGDLLFGRDMLELPICEISPDMRFQDAKKMRIRSYVYNAYSMAEERRKRINRESKRQIEEAEEAMAQELRDLAKIKVAR